EAYIQGVVCGYFRASRASVGIAVHHAVAVRVPRDQGAQAVGESTPPSPGPLEVSREGGVEAGRNHPIQSFLIAHEAEAVGKARHLVGGSALGGEAVVDPLVVGERDPE